MEEIFKRRSIRHYLDKPVEEEKINEILKAAMASPSAKNERPWEFYVIANKEILLKLSTATPYAHPISEAPLGIAMFTRKDTACPCFQDIDCGIASENILLEATHLGLGAVMIGVAPTEERERAVEEILQAPASLRAFALFSIGYPAYEPKPRETFEPDRIHYVK